MKKLKTGTTNTTKTDSLDSVFKFITENSSDVLLFTDQNKKIIYASPSLKEIYGYSIHELNNLILSDIIHPDDFKRIGNELENFLNGRETIIKIEFRAKTKKGKYIPTESILRSNSESNNRKYITLINCRDISFRKEAEIKLKENEEKLRKIFEASPEAIFITGSDLKIHDCNTEAVNLFGYSKKEFSDIHIYDLIDNLDKEKANRLIGKNKGIGELKHMEFYLTNKNAEKINILVSCNIIKGEQDEIKFYIFIIQNIFHFKKIESELIKSKEKAEETDKLKSAFLANMSHEIRTPMNSIIGFSDLLADPSLKPQDIGFYTSIIKDRCNNLLHIVNDILDISKIEANQVELFETSFSINSMLEDLYITFAQKLINENKFKVVLNLSKISVDEEHIILADQVRLNQILSNLLDNAIKFTKEGEIEFGFNLKNNGFVHFFVRDTGIGIHPDKHQIIFERFRQIDESLDREYGGNGLGLAICKAFVEIMGGEISLKSEPDKGSTFNFTIKNKKTDDKKITYLHNTAITHFKWKGKRILVVEDDKASLTFMKVLFTLTEAEVVMVQSGHEAINLFMNDKNFDLILMDIQLPDINGLEVTKAIKGIKREVGIIAQTAYAMQGDNEKCLKAGCDDYIAKPIDISDLFYKMNKFLEEK